MWKFVFFVVIVLGVSLFGLSLVTLGGGDSISASAELIQPAGDISGFARAVDPYDWSFPADYGPLYVITGPGGYP